MKHLFRYLVRQIGPDIFFLTQLINFKVNCWPTPSNDGTCDVNIEYELENERLTLHDVVISIPLPYV